MNYWNTGKVRIGIRYQRKLHPDLATPISLAPLRWWQRPDTVVTVVSLAGFAVLVVAIIKGWI